MKRRKPKLIPEPETKRFVPPFALKEAPQQPLVIQERKEEERIILLTATAVELSEKRKPQLILPQTDEIPKELPFKVTSEPLPPPSRNAYPEPPIQKPIPESEYLNQGALQSDEEKEFSIFLTNYVATYGQTSRAETKRAFQEFQGQRRLAKALSKNPELRIKIATKAAQWPDWVHVVLIGCCLALFFKLRASAAF